ncbi:hypothetical protein J6590_044408 [Homalodisca vitripennis]|nr:hypothetical protein J6590_044408 [Homalodisca vitripennis]
MLMAVAVNEPFRSLDDVRNKMTVCLTSKQIFPEENAENPRREEGFHNPCEQVGSSSTTSLIVETMPKPPVGIKLAGAPDEENKIDSEAEDEVVLPSQELDYNSPFVKASARNCTEESVIEIETRTLSETLSSTCLREKEISCICDCNNESSAVIKCSSCFKFQHKTTSELLTSAIALGRRFGPFCCGLGGSDGHLIDFFYSFAVNCTVVSYLLAIMSTTDNIGITSACRATVTIQVTVSCQNVVMSA